MESGPPPVPPDPVVLPKARRLITPTRESLLERFAANEARSRLHLGLELAAVVLGAAWWWQRPSHLESWETLAIGGAGFLGMFTFLFHHWATPRKAIHQLRDETRLGPHSRVSLLSAVGRAKEKLGLSGQEVKVFLTPEKDINAYALRQDLLPGVRLLNGVQLNRSIVHLLDEEELTSVIAHELGHVFPYSPVSSRCLLLHALFSAVISLIAAEFLSYIGYAIAAPVIGLAAARWLAWASWTSQSRLVEFLCDDCGALAAGLIPAVRSELKIAYESEARSLLLEKVLEAKVKNHHIPVKDLLHDYEKSLPFGATQSSGIHEMLERRIQQRMADSEKNSLRGFIDYIWKNDDADTTELSKELAKNRAIRTIARVPFQPSSILPPEPIPAAASIAAIAELVEALEQNPQAVLTTTAEEITDLGSTHPNVSRRILFLWRNRAAYPAD